jgi:hypothetical protein
MAAPARKQCNVRLPVDLIDLIDNRRASIPHPDNPDMTGISRDEWIRRALVYALTIYPTGIVTQTPRGRTAVHRQPRITL